MKPLATFSLVVLLAASAVSAQQPRTYVGVITDTMCGKDHKPMKVSPDPACVRECARNSAYKYALNDGTHVYPLSDQQTPAQFAGAKVKVTGVLFTKTNILRVDAIARAN